MENLNAPPELSHSASHFIVNLKKHGKVGFGFEITGGQEHGTQVVISRIVRRGPAEGFLQVGDEIQYVNGLKVISATGDHVIKLVKNAELLGEVNLGIYRNLARMEYAMYVATSSPLPQQRYAPVELPNSSSKDPNYHYGIPAQRNSGTEAASDGPEESTAVKQKRKGSSKGMSVVVFKSEDVVRKGSTVIMPNTLEMAQIKKPHKGQFKTGVQISSTMTTAEVKTKLKGIFPILHGERFYCASNSVKEGKLKLYGAPSVWDGKSIRQRVTGNSALYVLIEDAATEERISQGMQFSMPGTPQMNAATALAPGEATLQSQNMPESRPQSGWSDPSDSVHRQSDRAEVVHLIAPVASPLEDLNILDTYLHSASGKDDLPELQNFEDIEPMDTSQPMNTKPSGDESGWSDPSDSGHGQSDKAEERGQEVNPSVANDTLQPVRSPVREVKSHVDKIVPPKSPLEGGEDFILMMKESLPPYMESGVAFFGNVPTTVTKGKHGTTLEGIVPPSDKPGMVTVTALSVDGIFLGDILFEYVDLDKIYLKRLVTNPNSLKAFYMLLAEEQDKKIRESEKQPNLQLPYIVAGSSQAFHVLATLVFAAAEYDALGPIKNILESSNGSAVFHAYKDSAKLPGSVARDHGNHEVANYLKEVTNRFYEEIESGKECNQTVDWLELLNAVEEGQTRLNHDADHHLESDRIQESGYSADVELSSSSSSDRESSDSELFTPTSSPEGIVHGGNVTQHEKNHRADTNTDGTPSSFTLQEVTNLLGIAEDDSDITPSAAKGSNVTPSSERERSGKPSAAEDDNVLPSFPIRSVVTLSASKEVDLELSANVRDLKPSNAEGTVESENSSTFEQLEVLKEKLQKPKRMSGSWDAAVSLAFGLTMHEDLERQDEESDLASLCDFQKKNEEHRSPPVRYSENEEDLREETEGLEGSFDEVIEKLERLFEGRDMWLRYELIEDLERTMESDLPLCSEADASPMRHSLAISRRIPRERKELLDKKIKLESIPEELNNFQDSEGKEKLGKTTLITEKQPNLQPPRIVLTPAGGKL